MVRRNEVISQNDIEELLSTKASGVIPYDKKIIISQNQGIPVISLRAKVNTHFNKLTNRLNRLEIVAKKSEKLAVKGECVNET